MGFQIIGDNDPKTLTFYKDTTTSVIARGDLCMRSSGTVIRMAAETDNLESAFIAMESSPAGENNGFACVCPWGSGLDCEFEYALDAATTVAVDDKLNWSARQTLHKGTTDAIAMCTRAGTSVTRVRCRLLQNQKYTLGDAS